MDDRHHRYCSWCGEEMAASADACPSCQHPGATEGDSFGGWVKRGGRYLRHGLATLAGLAVVVVIVGGTLMSTYGDLIEWVGEKAGFDLGMLNPGPDNDCEGFRTWYDQTQESTNLADVERLVESLDQDTTVYELRDVAATMGLLADQQEWSEPPEAAAEANRLAVLQLRTAADMFTSTASGDLTRARELISESESLDEEYRTTWDRVRRKCS